MFQAALVASLHNSVLKTFADRLGAAGKPHKVVMTALARKLVTIVNALVKALLGNYASVISNVVYTDPLGLFLSRMAEFVPKLGTRFGTDGNKVLPKNGGVESVETAIKMARFYGWKAKGIPDGKQEIIVFDNNFHGRMISVVSFSSTEKYRRGFGPLTPGFVSVPFGDLEAVAAAVNENTCGILVEPMQGEGGMQVPPPGFLKGLREIADHHDLLLLFVFWEAMAIGSTVVVVEELVVVDGMVVVVVVVELVVTVVSAALGEHEAATRPATTRMIETHRRGCTVKDRTTHFALWRGSHPARGSRVSGRSDNQDPPGRIYNPGPNCQLWEFLWTNRTCGSMSPSQWASP